MMNKQLSVQSHAALVAVTLISSLIYFLAISAKVPIRATVSTPSWEIIVEIHLNKSPSRLNSLNCRGNADS
jgi:hypothetical protein